MMTADNRELYRELGMTDGDAERFAGEMLGLGLHVRYGVSTAKAAEVAGVPLSVFMRFLGSFRIGVFDYGGPEELAAEAEDARPSAILTPRGGGTP